MSPAVESAVAPAALDMEALQRKLIALRGEIDAIVLQLAALTRPAAAACAAPAAEAPAQERSATPADRRDRADRNRSARGRACARSCERGGRARPRRSKQADAPDETENAEPSLDVMPAMEKPAATLTAALAACDVVTGDASRGRSLDRCRGDEPGPGKPGDRVCGPGRHDGRGAARGCGAQVGCAGGGIGNDDRRQRCTRAGR